MATAVLKRFEDGRHFTQTYEIDLPPQSTVLDLLFEIQQRLDATLSFRYSCRNWMCGSCGMLINGRERLACRTRLIDLGVETLHIAPLRNLPVVKDLIVDLAPFFEKWNAVGVAAPRQNGEPIPVAHRVQQEIDAHSDCITCALCYSACDAVSHAAGFLGPAALNRAYTLQLDARDAAHGSRSMTIDADAGVARCHSMGQCTAVCPKGLDPLGAMAALKRGA
jgi:succinate dehydrogenase iron-sulfur subunit